MDRLVVPSIATALTVAISMSTATARADEPARSLTMHDAIVLALAHNPDSRSTEEDVASAGGVLEQSKVLPNPSLFVYTVGRTISPFQGPSPTQYGVTWTIPIGGKREAGIESAEGALDSARATRIAARRQVQITVAKAFIAVLLDQSELDFASQDAKGIHQSLELNELRYKDGKIAYGDVLKLRLQVYGIDDTVHQDELTLVNDRAELARLTGEGTLAKDYTLVGNLLTPKLANEPVPEEVYARAMKQRTDYQAMIASERSLESAARQARRIPIPDLGVLADYDYVPGTAGAYDLELSATVPLFDRNTGNITQAEAAVRKARIATDGLRAQILEDVQHAVSGWQTARARLAVYDEQTLSAARESLDISKRTYEDGHSSLLDYLDAESTYRQVESAYRSAMADAMNAAATLRFVAGEDLP